MLVRQVFNKLFQLLSASAYAKFDLNWLTEALGALFSWNSNLNAQGLLLQICDVYIPELGKVDEKVSFETLATLLTPFLHSLATTESFPLRERIFDNIFNPLLSSNITEVASSDEDESDDPAFTYVDGGKMSKSSRAAVKELIN